MSGKSAMKIWPGEYSTVGAYTVIIKKSLKDYQQARKLFFHSHLDRFQREIFPDSVNSIPKC
ncbi:hypothetical protein SAMN05661012_05484 [Chitinophaga sancti]|uniref:Uncharacterized protein n=1 Tax=Chitinophaga sancti TaxID=1004 RepID=A0A1K1SI42_9BACT|nr:hypothetical protein SAMN05661012_05484 [Chitinophaga sancti]